jgi:hypothetical protein
MHAVVVAFLAPFQEQRMEVAMLAERKKFEQALSMAFVMRRQHSESERGTGGTPSRHHHVQRKGNHGQYSRTGVYADLDMPVGLAGLDCSAIEEEAVSATGPAQYPPTATPTAAMAEDGDGGGGGGGDGDGHGDGVQLEESIVLKAAQALGYLAQANVSLARLKQGNEISDIASRVGSISISSSITSSSSSISSSSGASVYAVDASGTTYSDSSTIRTTTMRANDEHASAPAPMPVLGPVMTASANARANLAVEVELLSELLEDAIQQVVSYM